MRLPICLSIGLLMTLIGGHVIAADPRYDFRIVIDVSGSMKQTDPQNLRIPALKLINGLIPSGSRAGVWTFGRYVDVAVKWGQVDDRWRARADRGAVQIHSNALLTNIDSALARASVGWASPDENVRRILLLLTDGKVDVSKDPAKNAKSRAKVLGPSLSALKKAGVEVHTIALSDGTDEVLLKQLALETSGSFAIARSADELQKVFFKMFERASQPDTVTLKGKEFPIDKSIKEMTLLIFRSESSPPTFLIPPDSPAISAQKPRSARWRSDQGYDLITIKNPQAGVWRIDAEVDPDNRLMVVTDLKLHVGGLPAYGQPVEPLQVSAELFNHDKKISKNSFLRFVDFSVTHIDVDGNEKHYAMSHSPVRSDKGQYLYSLAQKFAEGTHQFIVSADSRTFNRVKRFDVQVQWPVEVLIEPTTEAGVYQLRLRARQEYIKADGMAVDVVIEAPDGAREAVELTVTQGWLTRRLETDQAGLYRAHIKVSARTHGIEIRDIDLGAFSFVGVYRAPLEADPVETLKPAEAVEPEPEPVAAEDNSVDWRFVGFIVLGVNVFLIVVSLLFWLIVKRKKAADNFAIEDEELSA